MKETNMEHYRSEIEAVEYSIALHNGEVKGCNSGTFNCIGCNFQNMYKGLGCQRAIIKWLMSPYKPEPVLTQREKHFVEAINNGFIARDKNNNLCWYSAKPLRRIDVQIWKNNRRSFSISISQTEIFANNMFPFITWEDEEPWSVEDLRKLKVGETDGC